MKAKFQILAALVCAAALTACGGGSNNNSTPVVVQPAYGASDLTPGSGADTAQAGKYITVNYAGWLYDASKDDKKGGKIDSSIDRGQPFAFQLGTGAVLYGMALSGWDQGLKDMKVGGKRKLILPAGLAYGAGSRDALKDAAGKVMKDANGVDYVAVPANAALVFEIEVLSVNTVVPPIDVTPPGLVKTDLKTGTGAEATGGKVLAVQYTGWLYDSKNEAGGFKGTQFDSSASHGTAPFSFTLGRGDVIKGWDIGVVGMKVGGKRSLIIPADLAYGAKATATIPANSKLVFEIELVAVQ
jgi:peptidylprolyl isomerase